jgi:cbb3-type cytochrome oxidase maturation protein
VDVLFLLIPLSLVLIIAIGVVFWWSVANGQYDDLEGPAHRILLDDEPLERSPSGPREVAGELTSINRKAEPRP